MTFTNSSDALAHVETLRFCAASYRATAAMWRNFPGSLAAAEAESMDALAERTERTAAELESAQ
jgi:hypothetical protein